MADKPKKFLIIDGNAIVHRAFHALPPLKTKQGKIVNAVYGFCLIFLKALREIEPEYIVAAFDVKGPTFRHKAYKLYKAKRKKAPDELYAQIDDVKKILKAFNVPIFERAGFEADDLIGTIVKLAKQRQALPKVLNIILTGDMDALQLVDEQTKVYTMRKGLKDTVLYDIEKTKERYDGLMPKQLTDYRALRGDPSDNIPGVTGIGEKTAISLLKEFGTLENLYKEVEKNSAKAQAIKKGVLEKLKNYKEQAFISQELARINQTVKINFELKSARAEEYNQKDVIDIFNEFEFYALLKKLPRVATASSKNALSEQQELFIQINKKRSIIDEINKLEKQGVFSPQIAQIERDLIKVVEQMEKNGIRVDIGSLNKMSKSLAKQISAIEKKIFKLAGVQFNVSSPSQVADILFARLGISTKGIKKTPGGAISTGVSELIKLKKEHSIIDLILEHRELFKLKTGFVDALPRAISKDGRIHPKFHQLGTETGRMSCSSPNLQNIPIDSATGLDIRKSFLPEKSFVFISADYSQMELRVAAAIAGDKKMLDAFKNNQDIHVLTASEIFNIPKEQVGKAERRLAKRINFGVLYGMGKRAFAESAGVDVIKAKEFIDKYFERFVGIAQYARDAKEQTKERGFAITMFGRKRFLPEINSADARIRSQAERMAVNMGAQGSAADIMKIAMNELEKQGVLNKDVKLILQIHDELLFEVKKEKARIAAKKIQKIMQEAVKLNVPLDVDIVMGDNWGEMVKIK